MQFDYPIYDADHHFYEPREIFDALPKDLKQHFRFVEVDGRSKLVVGGYLSDFIPNPTFEVVAAPGSHESWYRAKNPEGLTMREMTGKPQRAIDAFRNGEAHLKVLDEQNVHASIVFPTLASAVERNLSYDHHVLYGIMHALNDWMRTEWGFAKDGRTYAAPVISLMDLDSALEELDWLISEGVKVITVRPAPVPGYRGGRSPGFKEFDPFWARINESRVLVGLHSSDNGYQKYFNDWVEGEGKSNANTKKEIRPFEEDSFRETMSLSGRAIADTLAALVCHGVFDRFPDVRVASIENGSFWVRGLMEAFHRAYGKMPKWFKEDPHETVRRCVSIAPYYEDDCQALKEMIGVDAILFGSDWPHPEGLADPLSFVHELKGFSDGEIKKVMSTNTKSLLERVAT